MGLTRCNPRKSGQIAGLLLKLKWWDLDEETIKQIPYQDIDSAIAFLKKVRKKK